MCMQSFCSMSPFRLLFFVLILAAAFDCPTSAQSNAATASAIRDIHVEALPNGIRISNQNIILQITALRDDVLRVRAGADGQLPEDASWAVLPAARIASVQTVPEITDGRMGFHTASLRVTCDAALRLTVTDLSGKILQQDMRPIEWSGHGFHIYK